jgi:hypothetical protein
VAASGLLNSCSNQEAKNVAQQFLQFYYIDNNFEAAANLATEATREGLSHTMLLFEFDPTSRIDMFRSFSIVSMSVQTDKAICYYEVDNVRRRLLLSKVNGRWLVDMPGHVTRSDLDFSLTLSPPNSGGFASAESEMTRIGDVPIRQQ